MWSFLEPIRKWFRPPTIAEIAAHESRLALTRAHQATHVIETHVFDRHMALSTLRALDSYRAGKILVSLERGVDL